MTVTNYSLLRDCHGEVYDMAMSPAERQRKRRAKLKEDQQKPLLVRGDGGEFDERIRVALAVKELTTEGKLSPEVIELIIQKSEVVFPSKDLSTRKFIRKIVAEYLTFNK